jgi:aldose 1-epimerase
MVVGFGLALLAAHPPPPSFYNCSSQPKSAFEPVTLTSKQKTVTLTMIAYGATATHLVVKDRAGGDRDVLLGWDDATQYCANAQHTYFGATIGRVANRIANCSFALGGKDYATSCNEKDYDTLHGGVVGWDRRVWEAVARTSSSVTWRYRSPAGEMGFPGAVDVNVTHSIGDDGAWSIAYSAAADERTVTSRESRTRNLLIPRPPAC